MDSAQVLRQLMRRIGLDREEVDERCRMLDWQARDGERLNQAAAAMDGVHRQFVEQPLPASRDLPGPADLLAAEQVLTRLKHSQLDYYQRLWHGPYDRDYLTGRLHVGLIHQRAGVEPKWYLAAYRLYLEQMSHALFAAHPQQALFASLLKAVFFDMTLAIDTYGAAQRQALEDSEARFARALRGAHDGLWDWHLEHDRLYVSERWAGMLGLQPRRASARAARPGSHACTRTTCRACARPSTPTWPAAPRSCTTNTACAARTAAISGCWPAAWPSATTKASGAWPARRATSARARRWNSSCATPPATIPLTGLANRLRLDELLQQALQQLGKPGAREAALLFVDLDRFKLINDSLGHQSGDLVLVEVGRRLQQCLRPGDHLARFGGDEFVVCSPTWPGSDAEQVAQRMLDTLHQPLHLGEQTLVVSASIGIATLPAHTAAEQALQAADLALYRAKQAGKAQFARYSQGLQAAARRQLELESAPARPWSATSSSCTTSRSAASTRASRAWSGSRRCCAGDMPGG